jgi:hypothetical protein
VKQLLLITAFFLSGFAGRGLKNDSWPGRLDDYSGFIGITVLSNIDRQFFQYSIKQQCLSLAPGQATGYPTDTSVFRIIVPVREFICSNRYIYNDFLVLLKAEQYPYIKIGIPHNSCFQADPEQPVLLRGLSITVAGVTNKYDISCIIEGSDREAQILNGTAKIRLTDLKIVPPVRFMGLVKVKDEITINFGFCIKSSNDTHLNG